jgi:tripartite-type tricarboxylate transporter receptor subunit TctC
MRTKQIFATLLTALALTAPALTAPAFAQQWPERQVTMVVPFSAGGATDIIARLFAQHMQEKFGKPFIIENRVGAGGTIAAASVARGPKDSHTILFVSVSVAAINRYLYANPGYDPIKDFVPIGLINEVANILVVNPTKVAAKTLPEFVAFLKANPEKLSYASAGIGTSQQFGSVLLEMATGGKAVHVPYRSSGDITNALVSGHVDFAFDNPTVMLPHIQAGKVLALGIADTKRLKQLPDVPAITELYPKVVATSWNGVVMPVGTPQPVVDIVAAELGRISRLPEVSGRIEGLGATMKILGPEDFGKFIVSEGQKWEEVVTAAGIKPQ